MMSLIRYGLICGVLVLGSSASIVSAQQAPQLPEMGSTTTRVLSPEDERTFARDIERYFRAIGVLIEDPIIVDYMEDMGFRLVSHSSRNRGDFRFFVLRDPSINAFAAPAGVIGMFSGLILLAEDESEVAGVVAHEIAHITQDHLARAAEAAQQTSLPTMLAALGLAIAAGMSGSGDAAGAILMSGMGLATQFQINHTRQSEAEADRIGIGLLARSGYDPLGMARFFERLNVRSRAMGQGPPEYLRTHPLTVNRVAEARQRADQMTPGVMRDGELFHFVQARLRVMMSQRPEQAIEFFETRLERQQRPPLAMNYGLALALIDARQLDRARPVVDALLEDNSQRQLFRLLEADLLLAEGRLDESIDLLAELYLEYAGSRAITTQYASTLMHEPTKARAERAAAVLRHHLHDHPTDLAMTELHARAADRAGDPVRAGEALAESYYLRGGLVEAIDQLERLLNRDDLDFYQRSRVTARINDWRSEQIQLARR